MESDLCHAQRLVYELLKGGSGRQEESCELRKGRGGLPLVRYELRKGEGLWRDVANVSWKGKHPESQSHLLANYVMRQNDKGRQ